MHDLDTIDRRVAYLRDRLVSACAFLLAAAVAGAAVSELRAYFVLVALGAAVWALVEGARLRLAAFDRESALDHLVLAGSRDPRCERRRADLGSAQLQCRLAQILRETCEQSHCRAPGALWFLDRRTVHAVEHDLQELAKVFDHDAGHLPPAAVAGVHLLLSPRLSPLFEPHPDAASERRAIETAERIIRRCRAELGDPELRGKMGA
jgi:hypothetical protein